MKIEWRIRNLPYPCEVYNVTVEPTKKKIIVRTTNKKYYKSIDVPEVNRCQITLQQENISMDYKFNTLIILVIIFPENCNY
jgi:sulfate adenylyltransferase subunit 1 (EFTu-like GTPase family)